MVTGTSPANPTRLTPKQEAFARLVFQGLPQHEAYLKAGYSANQLPQSIDQNASRLAKDINVLSRINELHALAKSDAVATPLERKERLTTILRANVADFLDEAGHIKSNIKDVPNHQALSDYSVSAFDDKMVVKRALKLRDPIAAIAELNKMERVGALDTAISVNNDNRSVIIIVKSEDGKQALKTLKSGKLPQLK